MSPPPDKPSASSSMAPSTAAPSQPSAAAASSTAAVAFAAGDHPPSASFDPFASTASLPLLVRLPDGERHQVDVPPNASIKDLRSAIADMVDDANTSSTPWDLGFGGSILEDKHTLQHYNIPDVYDHANGLLKTISDSGYINPGKKVEALDKAVAVVQGISRGEHDMEKLISAAFEESNDAQEPASPSAQPSIRNMRRTRRSRIPSLNFANLPPPFPISNPKSAKQTMPSAPPTPSQLLRRLSSSRPDLYAPSAVPDDDEAIIPPVSPRMPSTINKSGTVNLMRKENPTSLTATAPPSGSNAPPPPPPTVTVSTAASQPTLDRHTNTTITTSKAIQTSTSVTSAIPSSTQQTVRLSGKPQQQTTPQLPQPETENQLVQNSLHPKPSTTQSQQHQLQPNQAQQNLTSQQPGEPTGNSKNGELVRGGTWFNDVISSFGNSTKNQGTSQSESDHDNDVDGDSEDEDENAPDSTPPIGSSNQLSGLNSTSIVKPEVGVSEIGEDVVGLNGRNNTIVVSRGQTAPSHTPGATDLSTNLGATAGTGTQNVNMGTKSEPAAIPREGSPNGTIQSGATSTMSVSSVPGITGASGGLGDDAFGATSANTGGQGQVIGLTPESGANGVVGPDGKIRKKRGRKRKNPHLSEEERKAQRQAQNRESAKLSRIRRKNMTMEYEKRVTTLEGENENLRDTVAALTDRLEMLQNLLTISVQKRTAVPPAALSNLASATQNVATQLPANVARHGPLNPAAPIGTTVGIPSTAGLAAPAPGIPVSLGPSTIITPQQGQGAFAAPVTNGHGGPAPLPIPTAGQTPGALPHMSTNFES